MMTNLGTIGMNMPRQEAPDEIWTCSNGRGDGDPSDPDDINYLRATPARIHAEELVALAQRIVGQSVYSAVDGFKKIHETDESRIARDLLARIEGKKP